MHNEEDGSLNTDVYRKPTHTDQYLVFSSHHPLEPKLAVIRTLHYQAESVPTKAEGKLKEHQHSKIALQTCGYLNSNHQRQMDQTTLVEKLS